MPSPTTLPLERRFSTAELAARSGLPAPTVKLLVGQGVLTPSIQQAQGRGHAMVFSVHDALAARAINALRFQSLGAGPLRHLAEFFRSERGKRFVSKKIFDESDGPRVLCVTANGVSFDTTAEAVMKAEETPVVYCLDARQLLSDVRVRWVADDTFHHDFLEPGPSGRAPFKRKANSPKERLPLKPEPTHQRAKAAKKRGREGGSR